MGKNSGQEPDSDPNSSAATTTPTTTSSNGHLSSPSESTDSVVKAFDTLARAVNHPQSQKQETQVNRTCNLCIFLIFTFSSLCYYTILMSLITLFLKILARYFNIIMLRFCVMQCKNEID